MEMPSDTTKFRDNVHVQIVKLNTKVVEISLELILGLMLIYIINI
jgi:hypothetical protein